MTAPIPASGEDYKAMSSKRIPLRKWAEMKYAALPRPGTFRDPQVFAISMLRYASTPYRRKGGRDPLNSSQRMHVNRWDYEHRRDYEHREQRPYFGLSLASQIVEAYNALLQEWYSLTSSAP